MSAARTVGQSVRWSRGALAAGYAPDALKAEIARFRHDYGLELVRRGYVVAAPCLTPFGRRISPATAGKRSAACERTYVRLQPLGRLLITENLRDILWALEFLAQQEQVDAGRLTGVEPYRMRAVCQAGCAALARNAAVPRTCRDTAGILGLPIASLLTKATRDNTD